MFANAKVSRWLLRGLLACFVLGLGGSVGCGPSQEELMMRAARRPRPDDGSESDSKPAPAKPAAAPTQPTPSSSTPSPAATASQPTANPPAATQPSPAAGGGRAASATSAADSVASAPAADAATADSAGEAATASFEPASIETRQPTAPWNEVTRRRRAADNIQEIARAFDAYVEAEGRPPLPAIKTQSGLPLLSWRVELLPYLGYADLYQQFNLQEPWDSPDNLKLLAHIPDCFVSPERWDEKTNYLGVAGRIYLFNGDPIPVRKIEDGLDQTLAIVEVNDEFAVPWTAPMDYAPDYAKADSGLGELRPEGTYAIWANGWPTFIKPTVSAMQLHKAFTYESTDGNMAGQLHNALRAELIRDLGGDEVAGGDGPDASATANARESMDRPIAGADTTEPQDGTAAAVGDELPQLEVPNRAAIAEATERVRQLYEERLKQARDLRQRRELADEMLESAVQMRADPAGAYSLIASAINIYGAVGELDAMLDAVDQQVAMFEVDAVEANLLSLVAFGERNGGAMAAKVDGREFLKRSLPVAYEAVRADQYDALIDLVQFGSTYESRSNSRAFVADINRLRTQLTAARNQYRRLGDALAELRENPDSPAAKSTVGTYVAFIKGDWDAGLPLLVDGSNQRLAEMAKADLATGSADTEMLATADAWWELGESTSNKSLRGACRQRASHWYAQAMLSLPESLSKLHAKSRWEEAQQSAGGGPLTTIEKLAEGLGVDLPAAIERVRKPFESRRQQRMDDDD